MIRRGAMRGAGLRPLATAGALAVMLGSSLLLAAPAAAVDQVITYVRSSSCAASIGPGLPGFVGVSDTGTRCGGGWATYVAVAPGTTITAYASVTGNSANQSWAVVVQCRVDLSGSSVDTASASGAGTGVRAVSATCSGNLAQVYVLATATTTITANDVHLVSTPPTAGATPAPNPTAGPNPTEPPPTGGGTSEPYPGAVWSTICDYGLRTDGVEGTASSSESTGYGSYTTCRWDADYHDRDGSVGLGVHPGTMCYRTWSAAPWGCEQQAGAGADPWRMPIPGMLGSASLRHVYGIPLTAGGVAGHPYSTLGEPKAATAGFNARCVEDSGPSTCPYAFDVYFQWRRSTAVIRQNVWRFSGAGEDLLFTASLPNQPNVFKRPELADNLVVLFRCISGFCNGEQSGSDPPERSYYGTVTVTLFYGDLGWAIGPQPNSCDGLEGAALEVCQGDQDGAVNCETTDVDNLSGDLTKPFICPSPEVICTAPTVGLDVVGWLSYISCQVGNLPTILYNALVVPGINAFIDFLFPGQAVGDHFQGFLDKLEDRQPFNTVGPLMAAMVEGMSGTGVPPDLDFTFTLGSSVEVDVEPPLTTAMVTLVPWRGLFAATVWFVVALKVVRLLLSLTGTATPAPQA